MTFNLTMYKENLPLMLLSLYPNKTVLTVKFVKASTPVMFKQVLYLNSFKGDGKIL